MPMYDYQCRNCDQQFTDVFLPISRRDEPIAEACPTCDVAGTIELCAASPGIGDAMRLGRTNLPSGWTDKLTDMKKNYRHNTINVPAPGKREI